MKPIYLDNNATSAMLPEVIDTMVECYHAQIANPASSHQFGRIARKNIEQARDAIGDCLAVDIHKVQADRIIFTSGATEANNLILQGIMQNITAGEKSHAIISAIEHPSVTQTCAMLVSKEGWQIDQLAVNQQGIICLDQLDHMITNETKFVSLMLANNETGAIQPIRQAAKICHAKGVLIHTDAAQAVGKIAVNFGELGVDAMTFTSHKLNGPRGIGALIVRNQIQFEPLIYGGFQQEGLRPGTETPELAVGFHKAVQMWQHNSQTYHHHLAELRDSLEQGLKERLPDIVIHAGDSPRLPNTSNIAFPGLDRQQLLMALDMQSVACSTGSACASGSSDPSPVLIAMGCDERLIHGSLRFSVSVINTIAEIRQATSRIVNVVQDLQTLKSY